MSEENFCHLAGELAISYNGRVLQKELKKKSKLTGTVLTRDGKVVFRNGRDCNWEIIFTPAVFLFYDNKSNIAYRVDTCKRCIEQIRPKGRILDCTDRKIYEIKDGKWCPVCDLRDEKNELTLVLAQSVPACVETILFDVKGSCPKVVADVSQIPADTVDFITGTVQISALNPGESKVLFYQTEICDEKVFVAQIFIGEFDQPRFSARCADTLLAGTVLPNIVNPCPSPSDQLFFPLTGQLFPLSGFEILYSVPPDQGSPTSWTVPETGDYDVHAVVSYSRDGLLPSFQPFDSFVLIQRRGAQSAIVGRSSILGLIGQAVFNVGLRLQEGDILELYLSGNPDTFATYDIIPLGTTFHSHFEGCAEEAPFPVNG